MMENKDVLKFHAIYYVEKEKVRLSAELVTGEPQQLDIEAVLLSSQTIYRGFMTDEMCDVVTVLEMLKMMQASLTLVEEGLLLRCSPIKILLTPSDEELDFREVRIAILEEAWEESQEQIRDLNMRLKVLEERLQTDTVDSKPIKNPLSDSRNEVLTYHVWPKARMMLSIVSRMLKEGLLSNSQKAKLKDMILDEDPELVQVLHEYEMDGDRRKLYSSFLKLGNS